MTRPHARTVDILADATHLALVGETAATAAERLGFDGPAALLDFLRERRYVGTARRLAENVGPSPSGAVEAFVARLRERNPDAIRDATPVPRHARAAAPAQARATRKARGAHDARVGPAAGGAPPAV